MSRLLSASTLTLFLFAGLAGLSGLASPAYADDTIATANQSIRSGFDGAKQTGRVEFSADPIDNFEIRTPSSGGHLSVFLTWDNRAADIDLYLLNASGTILRSSVAFVRDFEEVERTLSANTTYFIRVQSASGNANYTLYTVYSSLNSIDDHPADAARNSSSNDRELMNGNVVDDVVNSSDREDWFFFDLINPGEERITLTWSESNAVNLNVYEADGTTLIRSETNQTDGSVSINRSFPIGRFYIQVESASGGTATYSLSLTSPTDGGGSTGSDDCGLLTDPSGVSSWLLLPLGLLALIALRLRR